MKFILDRIKEPSTWTAIGVIGTLAGLPPGSVDLVHQIILGVVGLAGILLPEKDRT